MARYCSTQQKNNVREGVPVASPESTAIAPTAPLQPVPHSRSEDIYAITVGCVMIALGLALLRAAGLVTGGIAGVAP